MDMAKMDQALAGDLVLPDKHAARWHAAQPSADHVSAAHRNDI